MFVPAGYSPAAPSASILPPEPHWPLAAATVAGAAARSPAAAPAPGVLARRVRAAAIARRVNAAHAAAAARARAHSVTRPELSRVARRRKCRTMGDFFNLNMFTPAAIQSASAPPAPAAAAAPPAAASAPSGLLPDLAKVSLFATDPLNLFGAQPSNNSPTSGGGETYWQNLSYALRSPVSAATQVAGLVGGSTPGNVFNKIEAAASNVISGRMTPSQYQQIKYQMATNLKQAGATQAQVTQQEESLDEYVLRNTPGLAGGVPPGSVPDSKPTGSIPWWVLAAGGGAFLLILLAARR